MTDQPILIAQTKWLHKGGLFGHISNGGGEIPLENGFAIKFIASEKFCQLNLIHHGKGVPMPYQSWRKTKKVEVKKEIKEKQISLTDEVKEEVLL